MKQIRLSNGTGFALVSDEDFEFLDKFIWRIHRCSHTNYATAVINGRVTFMHDLILPVTGKFTADHKDRNGLNNQRDNLRIATHSQNSANRKLQKNNTSGYRGVSQNKATGGWVARIKINKNYEHIGTYPTAQSAARAYNKRALEVWGEFAQLNEFNEPLKSEETK